MSRRTSDFQTIRSEGGLLPPDLLRRVIDPKSKLDGTRPEDYGLPQGERLNEVITQSWNRLRKHWAEFRSAAANLPQGEPGTGLTNDKWSLPLLRELGFGLLPISAGPEIGGRTYAINRFFGSVPVHLVGCGLSLDRRVAGARGAAAANPHGLLQEFVNCSPGHRWAIVANGLRLRVLRDNQALSRQSFLEFDLEAMIVGEVYSDFVLLWLTVHATRFAPRESERPESCWLEQWTKFAEEQGTRALGDLRSGVEKALLILGEGFTSHPKNTTLREALRSGQVPLADFHGQLLRVVYRLIFLFVAEDRTLDGRLLLHPRDESAAARTARERFSAHYGTARLRELASTIKGSRHGDLWRQFQLLVGSLSGDGAFAAAREHLALPALGSFLWNLGSTAAINHVELTNHDFLEALRHLAFTRQGKVLRPVDYRNLGAEELGGVYESLLALTPQVSADGARFSFVEFAGNERKTSGSYYTPDSLVQCLLDSALDPVVEEAIKGKTGSDAEKAILALKVCDPAVGSGHFLVGAAHRLARHLARVRALAQGDSEPSPLLYQHALRDVIGRCLYGVDVNPMAAELCRVSLWLEALEPGKPLSFLDHHIRVGNSLLGTTPALIAAGLPDDAFSPIEGDDNKICSALKKRNKQEREGQMDMLHSMAAEPEAEYNSIAARTRDIDEVPDDTIGDVQRKAEHFRRLVISPEYRHRQKVADAWCAAFVWEKHVNASVEPITSDTIRRLEADAESLTKLQRREVEQLSGRYQFFHWHLAFPEVFAKGGFDCVLGNPPWERVKLQEQEFFASRNVEVAKAANAAIRKRMIAGLSESNRELWLLWAAASREAAANKHFLRNSGRYPLCGQGDLNTYSVFAEHNRASLSPKGRAGFIVPTGIATDDTTQDYFSALISRRELVRLYSFENEGLIFDGVHHAFKFALLVIDRSGLSPEGDLVFFARAIDDLADKDRHFSLSAADFDLISPMNRACPTFRSRHDAELTKGLHRRTPTFAPTSGVGSGWHLVLRRMMHMADDADSFRTAQELGDAGWSLEGNTFVSGGLRMLPLCEAKLVHHFDHRFATYDGQTEAQGNQGKCPELTVAEHSDPFKVMVPRYWVDERQVNERLEGGWNRSWILGWRDICRSVDQRTLIASLIPRMAIAGFHQIRLDATAGQCAAVYACLNALVVDYVARQKVGGTHLTYGIMEQLPILLPSILASGNPWGKAAPQLEWFVPRVLELTYTAWDLELFARDCGWPGPPFRWDEERRFLLRCELDAAFFHLYLPAEKSGGWRPIEGETAEELAWLKRSFPTPRDAVAYILGTFPIVRRKDEEKYDGDYRTKHVILEIYDAMLVSSRTGQPYQTRLDPPPADPRCCHPPGRAGSVVPAVASRQTPKIVSVVGQQEVDISSTDRHVLVLCRVIYKHRGTRHERTLGLVKAEKIAHIVESKLGIDLGREPKRLAAGPADFPHLKKVVHRAEHGFFAFRTEERTGGQGATFVAMNGLSKALRSFGEAFGEQAAQLDRIIEIFLPMDSEQAEIVATLYAVWNDLLACGATPTDNDIVDGFLAWSPTKQRIARDRLVTALRWMREKELVPTGTGKRTELGPQINA